MQSKAGHSRKLLLSLAHPTLGLLQIPASPISASSETPIGADPENKPHQKHQQTICEKPLWGYPAPASPTRPVGPGWCTHETCLVLLCSPLGHSVSSPGNISPDVTVTWGATPTHVRCVTADDRRLTSWGMEHVDLPRSWALGTRVQGA